MDILNSIYISELFLPLLFGIYLIYSRVALISVNKNILKWGNFALNSTVFVFTAVILLTVFLKENSINYSTNFFLVGDFNFDFGFKVNDKNIALLLYSSLTYSVISFFSKIYFDKKKQFLFTKQRYYIFLSLLSFNTYLFIISSNLFQGLISWIIQGLLIFVFSYFDLFKNAVNHNITRFARITVVGDLFLTLAVLILFKYAVISEGYINSTSLEYDYLNVLTSYMYGIASTREFCLVFLSLIIAFSSRLFVFPLSCYYSFFANSSNIFYISILTVANTVFGLLLFNLTTPYFELLGEISDNIAIYFAICAALSALAIVFEKNIKIIFGYIISALNSLFLGIYIFHANEMLIYSYFVLNFVILLIVMYLFIKDIHSIKRSLISKKTGFLLERFHIFTFEKAPYKMYEIFNLIDEKIFQNIVLFIVGILNIISTIFVIKTDRQSLITKIRTIFIVFAIVAIIAIFIAYFGRYNAGFIK